MESFARITISSRSRMTQQREHRLLYFLKRIMHNNLCMLKYDQYDQSMFNIVFSKKVIVFIRTLTQGKTQVVLWWIHI